jgi:hypothetical protein
MAALDQDQARLGVEDAYVGERRHEADTGADLGQLDTARAKRMEVFLVPTPPRPLGHFENAAFHRRVRYSAARARRILFQSEKEPSLLRGRWARRPGRA